MLRIVINMIYRDVGMQGSREGTDTVNRYSKKKNRNRYGKNVEFGWTKVSEKKKMTQGKQKGTKRMLWKMVGQ